MTAFLRLEEITKTYPSGTRALDGISLDVQRGEFVVLIGLSGSGKSTLLRCINKLVEPSGGRVILDGIDVTAAKGAELRRIRGLKSAEVRERFAGALPTSIKRDALLAALKIVVEGVIGESPNLPDTTTVETRLRELVQKRIE